MIEATACWPVIPAKAGTQGFKSHGKSRVLIWTPAFAGETVFLSKQLCVYILASQRNGTLYIGVTSDLVKRGWQHRCNGDGMSRNGQPKPASRVSADHLAPRLCTPGGRFRLDFFG